MQWIQFWVLHACFLASLALLWNTAHGKRLICFGTLRYLGLSVKIMGHIQCTANENKRNDPVVETQTDLHLANGRHPRFCTNPSHWECQPAARWAVQHLITASNDWHVNPSSGIMLARLKSSSCNWWSGVRHRDGAIEWLDMAAIRWY